jgi:hypothetical protein
MIPRAFPYHESDLIAMINPEFAQRLVVVSASFVTWALMFIIVYSRPTSKRLAERAARTAKGIRLERAELANRVCALVHATVCSLGAVDLLFFRNNSLRVKSVFDYTTWPTYFTPSPDLIFYACFTGGFFVADLMFVVILFEENGLSFLIHAVLGLTGSMYCIVTDCGLPYYALLLLVEISTPFLNFRWLLLEYGYKGTTYDIVNGLLLVLTFTVARNIVCNVVCVKLMYDLQTSLVGKVSVVTRIVFTVCSVCMMGLNTMWGFSLWKGFVKTLFTLLKSGRGGGKVVEKVE